MEVLNKHNPVFGNIKEKKTSYNIHSPITEMPSENFEMMHPVASGDNMATMLRHSSPSRLKHEDVPVLIPCCDGKELAINPELVRSGLSAISIRRAGACAEEPLIAADLLARPPISTIEHRNSFRCVQRPDLRRVPHLRRLTPAEIDALFAAYAGATDSSNTNRESKYGNQSPDSARKRALHDAHTDHCAVTAPKRANHPPYKARYNTYVSMPTAASLGTSDY